MLALGAPAHALGTVIPVISHNIAPPVTKLKTATLVSPTAGRTYFGGGTTRTNGLSLAASALPEIVALAKSLKGGRDTSVAADRDAFAQNISDYVRNNINTEFRYGLSKGGNGALIDQSGTPFDQAELMIFLLRQENVTASYVVGDVTLTAAEFGKWTGLVKTLNESAQTFSVDAKAACQLLSDGGIPATVNGQGDCASVSGSLSTVTMSHIWVQVVGSSTNYDPSYKVHSLRNGIDVPQAMNCGSQAASTCGSEVSSAGMVGATSANWSTPAGNVPYVSNYNLAAAKSTHDTQKSKLLTHIKSSNINGQGINASVYDVLGGKQLNPQTGSHAPLSYASTGSWSGVNGIPNQFRTKLNIKYYTSACGSFYADELAGRRLVYKKNVHNVTEGFVVDGQPIANLAYAAASTCSPTASPYLQIAVDHPYPASSGAYADDVVNFKPVDPPSDETGFNRRARPHDLFVEGGGGVTPPPNYIPGQREATDYPEQNYLSDAPMTIVHGFGQASMSAQKYMSDLLAVTNVAAEVGEKCGITTVSSKPAYRGCNYSEQAVVAATFAAMRTLTDRLVDGVAKTVTTRHHDIGMIYPGRSQGLSFLSVQESLSITPASGLAGDRQAAFDMSALALAEAESRAAAVDSAPGISAARAFFVKDFSSALPAISARIYDVAPLQMTHYVAALPRQAKVTNGDGSSSYGSYCIKYLNVAGEETPPEGCWRHQALQDVANQGYSTLIMEGGLGELFYNGTGERAFTMWEYVKGGSTIGDGLATAMKTTEVIDQGALRRKFLSVSPGSGDLSYTSAADIVTGTGEFPYSLPFQRTFTPTHRERFRDTSTYYYADTPGLQTLTTSATITSGADSQYHDRLGGGWTHNYQIRLTLNNDLAHQLGSENAAFATEFIAVLQVIKDLGTSGTLPAKIASVFAINNMDRTLPGYGGSSNTVTVTKGTSSISFHKMVDGVWMSSAEPDAKLDATLKKYTSGDGDMISFSPYRYDEVTLSSNGHTLVGAPATYSGNKMFKADKWTFPNGVVVDFHYDALVLSDNPGCSGSEPVNYNGQYGYLLKRVSNNLGRQLSFDYDNQWTRQSISIACLPGVPGSYLPGQTYATVKFHTYRLKQVTDLAGRAVTFAVDGIATNGVNSNFFTVTEPATATTTLVTRYEYSAAADSPDPGTIRRNDYQLRRWFSPRNATTPFQAVRYDGLYRVSKITDRNGNVQTYYPSGMFDSELWKRTELVDGTGNVSLENYNEKNGNILSRDPTGSVTLRAFDSSARLVRTAMPEGNAEEKSYDIRGNVVRVCRIGKDRPGQSCNESLDSFARTSYYEGALVLSCTNIVKCNKPETETDARGNVTNYAWDGTTGNLTQILQPTVLSGVDGTNIRPQTDATYATTGIALLTSKTEKISGTQSITTTYEYNANSALKSVIVDSGGAAPQRTCLAYDSIGNLLSKTEPNAGQGNCP